MTVSTLLCMYIYIGSRRSSKLMYGGMHWSDSSGFGSGDVVKRSSELLMSNN